MTTPIYGDDLTTAQKEGTSIGEELRFSWNNQLANVTSNYKGDYGIDVINLEFKLEDFSKPEFKLHPNPTTGQFLIESNLTFRNQELSVNVFGLDGQLYQSINTNITENINVDLSDLPNGVYMVQLQSHNFTKTKKLIKH